MQLDSDALFQAAQQLPPDEQLGLAVRLLDAVPDDLTIDVIDPRLMAELDERFADTDGPVSWSDLSAEDD